MPDDLDPKKYHVINPDVRRNLIFLVLLTLFTVIPALFFVYYKFAITRPSQTSDEVTIEVGRGNSVAEIAESLYQRGAINSSFLFNLYVFLSDNDQNLQAGVFTIPAGTSVESVVEILKQGRNDKKITFYEGQRIEEYAKLAAETFENVSYEKFVELAKPYEGYLFPDTYVFNHDIEEENIIDFLKKTFDEKTEDILTDSKLKRAGLSKEEAVILASIVERESRDSEERPVIAGILIKRWKADDKIDADATTQYVVALKSICPSLFQEGGALCVPTLEDFMNMDWWPKELTLQDLDYDSPYNTRKNIGLPPAPISSVSISSLEAVVESKPTNYYFYMHDPEGNIYFAETLEEHNMNVAKYL